MFRRLSNYNSSIINGEWGHTMISKLYRKALRTLSLKIGKPKAQKDGKKGNNYTVDFIMTEEATRHLRAQRPGSSPDSCEIVPYRYEGP